MAREKKPPSNKVILRMEGLPEPWVAVQHMGKENQIYFYNKETKEALWTEDFERIYGRLGKRAAAGGNRRKEEALQVQEIFYGEEPMEVDIDYELKEYRSQGVGHFQTQESVSLSSMTDSLDETKMPSISSVVAVLDTSVLVSTQNLIKKTAAAGVYIRVPYTTLQELDGLKKSERLRYDVNAALSQMETLHKEQPDLISFESSADRVAQIQLRASSGELTVFKPTSPDDYIIKTALRAKELVSHEQSVVLVSNDYNMRVKASADGLKAVGATEFLSGLLASPRPKKELPVERKKDKKALGPHLMNFKSQPHDALNQTHPPAAPNNNKKKKKKKPPVNTTIGPLEEHCPASSNAPVLPKLEWFPVPVRQTRPPPTPSAAPGTAPVQPPSTTAPWHKRVPPNIPDAEKPCWLFPSETRRFQYILKQATDAAIERLEQKTEDSGAVSEAMQQLARVFLKFFEKYDQDKFREAIRLTEELYISIIGRLTTFQLMDVDKLETEVKKEGADCEFIVTMRDYISYLKSKGWVESPA